MNSLEYLQMFAMFVPAVALIVVIGQLWAVLANLKITMMTNRHRMFVDLTSRIAKEEVETMLLHPQDHFNMKVFANDYEGNERRIQSYALMKKKYVYLVYALTIRGTSRDPFKEAANAWVDELIQTKEFRDLHNRQKKYYGKASKIINNKIKAMDEERMKLGKGHAPLRWMLPEQDQTIALKAGSSPPTPASQPAADRSTP